MGDFFVFLRCNADHHAANFMASAKFEGMPHVAYEMRGPNHLIGMLDHMGSAGSDCTGGQVGHNLFTYHKDPDGNTIELFAQIDVIHDESKGYWEPRPWHETFLQCPRTWDSISDMDLLRHGGMTRLFDGVRAPSTLGTFLRRFTFGQVRQLDAVAARLLTALARATPILPGAAQVSFLDIDDTVRQTYGYAKQGAGRGYTGVNGLNALLATLSTPLSVPVIAAARLRRGSTNSCAARPACSPKRWPPPDEPELRPPGTACCWCGRTRRSTATTSSRPAAAAGPGSRSPPG